MKTVVAELEQDFAFGLNDPNRRKAMTALNMHHFNDPECNILKDGQYVSKYPELETPEVQDSYYSVCRDSIRRCIFRVYSDGTFDVTISK